MSLEDFSPDIESSQGLGQSSEKQTETSEKYKESQKKAGKKIQKTKKDETKAKKYDILLAGFLAKIIVNKKYDSIHNYLFESINIGYPSNFILGILSLIYIDISKKLREVSSKDQIIFAFDVPKERQIFDDHNIDSQIQKRINDWIEDIISSVSIEYSSIQTNNLKQLFEKDKEILLHYTSQVFDFFLNEINFDISEQKSVNISNFIISEVEKSISKLKIEDI